MFAILTNDIQYLSKEECTIRFMGYKVSPEGRITVSARHKQNVRNRCLQGSWES